MLKFFQKGGKDFLKPKIKNINPLSSPADQNIEYNIIIYCLIERQKHIFIGTWIVQISMLV